MDIRLQEPETTANLAQQAVDYSNTIGACLAVEGCVGITVWDFYDPVSSSLLNLGSNVLIISVFLGARSVYRIWLS